ncbi:MAG: mycofactocin precursor MftA [Acidimicrobiales bacterium]|nr:mycofactocin precursor MftA [Acidimicrobiales bacterium]MDG1876738.1 mycofactocin precursor MftA [Acidimicrobiales bacterium]
MEPTELVDETPVDTIEPVEPDLVEEELLVEEISIDGMCGVY